MGLGLLNDIIWLDIVLKVINAHAPGTSNSIYISKTNQKLNISYISKIKALKGKFFPVQVLNKPTLKFQLLLHTLGGLFIITTIHTLLRNLFEVPTFVTYTRRTLQYYYDSHFATEFIWRFKINVIPYPSTLNCQ